MAKFINIIYEVYIITSSLFSNSILEILETDRLHRSSLENMIIHYKEMRIYYALNKPEEIGLHGGKFCEHAANLVLWILKKEIHDKPKIEEILQKIDKAQNNSTDDMIRITIPRMIRAAYEMRSKRDSVHVNREIKVNDIDARVLLAICGWILAEFLRAYGTKDIKKAAELIDKISKVDIPLIDDYKDRKLIMSPKFSVPEEVLIHLTNMQVEVDVNDLVKWIPNLKINHLRTVLRQLKEKRFVYYEGDLTKITPLGTEETGRIIKSK